mgnify:CR=1 FL=1
MSRRYAVIGAGSRGLNMFARPLLRDLADCTDLVGLCDLNPLRLASAARELAPLMSAELPTFVSLTEMLATVRPDALVVATVDRTHAELAVQAMHAGCDVILEKPMATTAEGVLAILRAERETGRQVKVSFNARYGAAAETIARLLRQGAIGRVLSAEFVEYLDTSHGADYFRRWHRRKENSGGLLVHKASHHFDQLNWWLSDDPVRVYADGGLRFYGPTRLERGERCRTCAYYGECPFFLDIEANEQLRAMYLETESADAYWRDRCVFAREIDIEDTLGLVIRYQGGAIVTYALCAFAPYEGQRIGFNGTQGRLEVDLVDRYHGPDDQGTLHEYALDTPAVVRVSPLFGRPFEVPIEQRNEVGHGGADARIRNHLFRPEADDPLAQRADARAGALSALVGIAGNRSLATGAAVDITKLLEG